MNCLMKIINKIFSLFQSTISIIVTIFFIGLSISIAVRVMVNYGKSDTESYVNKVNADPYEDERQWLTDDNACQKLEDEKNYCIEIKDQCKASLLFGKDPFSDGDEPSPFQTCVAEVRERLGMHPVIDDQFYNPIKID